ncbi:SPW repeat protein [Arhodomonas sp. AD133]|uniref:SPW repeat protein n=1 Tax=Arhodomonas sp. AD133 TaxID=3415009 RepID=UPI003EBCFE8A
MATLRERWRDWLMLLFGLWMIVSPFVLGSTAIGGAVVWNPVIIGIAVAVFAAAVLARPYMWEEWVNLVLGVWLILAPFVLGFAGMAMAATWNHIIFGVLIGADAIWSLMEMRQHGHGEAT